MTLTARLDEWRRSLNEDRTDHPEEGREPVTDEEALAQFLYSGVSEFIDAELDAIINDFNMWAPGPDDRGIDLDKAITDRIDAWVDRYGGHAIPLTDPPHGD